MFAVRYIKLNSIHEVYLLAQAVLLNFATLQWSEPNEGDGISGRVFKITFRCEYAKNGPRNGLTFGCIMLKSNGSVQSKFATRSLIDDVTRFMTNCLDTLGTFSSTLVREVTQYNFVFCLYVQWK